MRTDTHIHWPCGNPAAVLRSDWLHAPAEAGDQDAQKLEPAAHAADGRAQARPTEPAQEFLRAVTSHVQAQPEEYNRLRRTSLGGAPYGDGHSWYRE